MSENQSIADKPAMPERKIVSQHIIEFVSDAGEGAQTAGQCLGTISAKMGNGIWTVEIIPAEVEPPRRSRAGASGNRVRIGSKTVTNAGDQADLVVAFNEQVLYSRFDVGALREGTIILLDNVWQSSDDPNIQKEFEDACADFRNRKADIRFVPFEAETKKIIRDPRHGKNVWALGLICAIYDRDIKLAENEITRKFAKKSQEIVDANLRLLHAGYDWAMQNMDLRFSIPAHSAPVPQIVVNGNIALALGIMASGIEVCSMYPITPATSISHYLAEAFPKMGCVVHQAEDEIAAIGFAIGASFAGKTPVTITSGPGLALKNEFMALAIMAELPLVVVIVQRGGPSTGLPTRVEQGDLLSALYAQPGDAPKIVMAPSTHEECFRFVITARKLAETFRTPVIILSDANLATGQQPIPRPSPKASWFAPPIDLSDWDESVPPFEWDPETGLSQRPIPGQKNGNYVVTGLAHDQAGHVAYESSINEKALQARSRKLATLQHALKSPQIHGDPNGGDLLVVGWGSPRGAIEEAVDTLRAQGVNVSSVTLKFLSPLEPGLKEIFSKFKRILCVEMNYSDPKEFNDARRYSQLCTILRSHTLCDIDCWSHVRGIPLTPKDIEKAILDHINCSC